MFAAGIVVGIGLTFLGQKFWRETRLQPAVETGPTAAAVKIAPSVTSRNQPTRPATTTTAVTPPATEPVTPADTLTARPHLSPSANATIYRLRRVMAAISFLVPPDRINAAAQEAGSSMVTTARRIRAELTLRGQLRSETTGPLSIEFSIRRLDTGDGNNLTGVVRYLNRNDLVVGHQLEGRISNRTLALQETSALGNVGEPRQSFLLGRTFVIHLPKGFIQDDSEIDGTWSIGTQSGTLLLKLASPW